MEENGNNKNLSISIDSQTINKAIDTFGKPLYDDVAKPTIQTSKGALGFCSQFIVSGIKPYMYSKIKECEYKIKEIDKRLEEKYNKIPDENKTEPRTNILGPAVDVLKYNLEEEHIKKMFINLIGNDMDKNKQSRVLPSYIEIVKQLSKDDAELLKFFKENKAIDEPIMKLKLVSPNTPGYTYISNNIVFIPQNKPNHCKWLDSMIIDNLLRLHIIEITFSEYKVDDTIYKNAFENIEYAEFADGEKLDYSKGILKISDFGKNFIDICLS